MDENTGPAGENGGDEGYEGSQKFGRAREFVGSKYNQMREKVEDVDFGAVTDQVRTYVRSNPGKALLMSIGLGFVIGLMLRGDDED
jgi:ElaB/YqjD/DUF883 family membrane-anchored ribosome-binding protein